MVFIQFRHLPFSNLEGSTQLLLLQHYFQTYQIQNQTSKFQTFLYPLSKNIVQISSFTTHKNEPSKS
ncbi:unnamed protein product [Lathyrus sativus]|nr:unnamed protein product [Lathyrus sativus]